MNPLAVAILVYAILAALVIAFYRSLARHNDRL